MQNNLDINCNEIYFSVDTVYLWKNYCDFKWNFYKTIITLFDWFFKKIIYMILHIKHKINAINYFFYILKYNYYYYYVIY